MTVLDQSGEMSEKAPLRPNDVALSGGEHFVQFYEQDHSLVEAVADYVAAGFTCGERALVIATSAHRQKIDERLEDKGFDPTLQRDCGQYVALDVAETLNRFMMDGAPDAALFEEVVGSVVGKMARGKHRLRAFGEMVAVLWAGGEHAAAMRLEELWNRLMERQSFTLLCAYPMNEFNASTDAARFRDICSCHSKVIPAESYAMLASDDRHREISLLQQKALALHSEVQWRQQAQAAMYESQARFRAVVEATPECVKVVAPDGSLQYMNRAGLAMIGMNPDEAFAGACVFDLIAPEYRERWQENHARVCRGERLVWEFEIVGRSGTRRWMETHAVPLPQPGGGFAQLAVTRDISERKRQEEERERLLESERAARTEAERASRLKDEFLATLSHELRTPLSAIVGWSQILKKGQPSGEDLSEGLAVIERNARVQAQIIEDLLDLSRISSGKIELNVRKLSLADVVQAAVASVRPSAAAKNITMEVSLDPAWVLGDAGRLQQVVWNLLVNAVKFTPREGRVRVEVTFQASDARIVIADNGEGIEAEFLPHLFERFRQADASTSRHHGGLGIGLAIVKQIVDLHGGSVTAHSEGRGKGSTLCVTLPLAKGNAGEGLDGDPSGPLASLTDERITLAGLTLLMVDDEPDSRLIAKRVLEEAGATVLTADSAVAARQIMRDQRPDILLSDIGMPGEDGYQFIRSVRRMSPEEGGRIPAVALTAFARPEDRRYALWAGFQSYVPKPFDPLELATVVASLAGRTGA